MAAPMTPASPTRDQQIVAKENAIKKRITWNNTKNRLRATADANKEFTKKKGKAPVVKTYDTQKLLGEKEGYTKSDYGIGQGAAIPYQIKSGKDTVVKSKAARDAAKNPPPKLGTPPSFGAKKAARDAISQARANAIARRASQAGTKTKGL